MSGPVRLRVDRIACDGRGHCAELLPERITLDEWDFPIIATEPVGSDLRADARAAVRSCPTLALRLEQEHGEVGRRRAGAEG